ncbi:hypothetical protein ACB094_11G120100 [Castanea mollissima]
MDLIHFDSPNSPFYNPSETHVISNRRKYLKKFSVGTPPVPILGIADTSSDLIWLQCKPCTECSNQTAPLFDPKMSITYKSWNKLPKGDLAMDTHSGIMTSRPMPFPGTIIGRGHDNVRNFDDKGSSIVGIGGGAVSLASQLSYSIGGKFSYSKLKFGSDAVVSGPGTVSTPLVPKIPDTFYFLTLDVTPRTQKEFYSKFESAVAEEINLERGDDPSHVLSLFATLASASIEIPIITAHFTGADVKLNPTTTFVQINEELVILGNVAQSNLLVGNDLVEKTVSFKPTDCIKL